jgi:glycerol-3-phosphate dehydrogenase
MVGTGEIIVEKGKEELRVPEKEMKKFIDDLNKAVPELNLTIKDVQRVYSGVIPASKNKKLSKRETIINHSKNGGPQGLYSLAGIKFTTSRLVAEKTIKKIVSDKVSVSYENIFPKTDSKDTFFPYAWMPKNEEDLKPLVDIIKKEKVFHLSDLILRRTSLGDNPKNAIKILPKIKHLFDFTENEWEDEINKLKDEINICYEVV